MARTAPRARPDREQVLETVHAHCPACGGRLRYRYDNRHTVTTLAGLVRLRLRIRRCEDPGCARYRRPYRPEAEGAHRAAAARVRPRRHRPGRRLALPRAPERAGDPPRLARARGGDRRAHGHPLAGSLRRAGGDLRGRRRPAAGGPGRAGAGDPGARRPPAGRRPRGAVGRARVPVGRGPARQEPAVLDGRGPGRAAARGRRRGSACRSPGVVSDGQHSVRLAVAAGAARGAAPAVPVPLPARGGAADLRGRPPRQEGAEEAGPRRAPDRARGGGPRRPRGRGGARLLRGRAQRASPTTAGRRWRPRGCRLAGRLEAVVASLDRVAEKGG